MTVITAADFKSRQELETKVANLIGLTPDRKTNYEIHGTASELARLQLSKTSIFWGISCVETDAPPDEVPVSKPERGDVHSSGINGNLKN